MSVQADPEIRGQNLPSVPVLLLLLLLSSHHAFRCQCPVVQEVRVDYACVYVCPCVSLEQCVWVRVCTSLCVHVCTLHKNTFPLYIVSHLMQSWPYRVHLLACVSAVACDSSWRIGWWWWSDQLDCNIRALLTSHIYAQTHRPRIPSEST